MNAFNWHPIHCDDESNFPLAELKNTIKIETLVYSLTAIKLINVIWRGTDKASTGKKVNKNGTKKKNERNAIERQKKFERMEWGKRRCSRRRVIEYDSRCSIKLQTFFIVDSYFPLASYSCSFTFFSFFVLRSAHFYAMSLSFRCYVFRFLNISLSFLLETFIFDAFLILFLSLKTEKKTTNVTQTYTREFIIFQRTEIEYIFFSLSCSVATRIKKMTGKRMKERWH